MNRNDGNGDQALSQLDTALAVTNGPAGIAFLNQAAQADLLGKPSHRLSYHRRPSSDAVAGFTDRLVTGATSANGTDQLSRRPSKLALTRPSPMTPTFPAANAHLQSGPLGRIGQDVTRSNWTRADPGACRDAAARQRLCTTRRSTSGSERASSLAKRAPGYTTLGFPDPRKLPLHAERQHSRLTADRALP